MLSRFNQPGHLRRAPESFLSSDDIRAVNAGRRDFLRSSLIAATAAMAAPAVARAAQGAEGDAAILEPQAWATSLGQPVAARPYGVPSQYESALQRRELPFMSKASANSQSFAPLQGFFGIITPSGLHYERHHQGWQDIDPSMHRLMITASSPDLIQRRNVYTMDELMRLPPVSRIHFLECGGNTAVEWSSPLVPTVQYTHGLLSCSEFTGVPLRLLLEHCGVDFKKARYVLAEGADGSSLTRTIPMDLVESGEAFVAYGQNGEMLRPEQGYPLRLIVPGVQGVSWVKWLRRIEVGDKPYGTREESLHYVDLMPDGQAPSIQLDAGVQVRYHHALWWPDAAYPGFLQYHRAGLVGARQDQAGGRVGRWGPQLAHGTTGGADAVQGAHPLQHRLGLERPRCTTAIARHRRGRTYSTRLPTIARCAWQR